MYKRDVVYIIKDVKDFEKLRNIKYYVNPIIVIDNDIDFKNAKFTPIDAEKFDVVINGGNYTLGNLTINDRNSDNVGLFSKVNSLVVSDLSLINFNIKGGVNTGSIAGKVKQNATINKSVFSGIIDAEAYAGGVVGSCEDITLNDSIVVTSVKGYDIIGGVAGMVSQLDLNNTHIRCTAKGVGKAVYSDAGYNSRRENDRIQYMLKEALSKQPVECSEKEMKKLARLLKE